MRALALNEVSFVSGGDGGATPPETPLERETIYFEDGSSQTLEMGAVVQIFDCNGNSIPVTPGTSPTVSEFLGGLAIAVGTAAASTISGGIVVVLGGAGMLLRGRGH